MAQELTPIDIDRLGGLPEFARLVDEVHRTGKPRRIRQGNADVAVLSPAPASPRRQRQRRSMPVSQADIDAAMMASWDGLVDPDELKQELDAARSDDGPPTQL